MDKEGCTKWNTILVTVAIMIAKGTSHNHSEVNTDDFAVNAAYISIMVD